VIDFRYHALSLVAVFLALGIGIVLGVTVGDSLVSDADRNLRDSLRGDVEEAREQARDQEALGERRDEVIDETAPQVAEGRLRGRRVALLALDELPGSVSGAVEDAVDLGGGRITRTAIVSPEDRTPALARLLERGGPRAQRLRRAAPRRFSGSYAGPVDALVVYRHPPQESEDDEAAADLERRERFEDRLVDGLRDNVVAVEILDTDPSQVGWYEEHTIASVDNLDAVAGRLALVLLLEEAAVADVTDDRPEGAYGYKDSADRALPELQESAEGASP
jgi:hypothetical protein